CASGITGTDYW
nr:immunoglobulin heavy chain junction region [Macaca mulatta]